MTVWSFKRVRKFVWKMLLESKTFLSSNISYSKLLNFPKIETVVQTYSFIPGGSNLAILVFSMHSFHFWHSLSYSLNIKIIWEKFGHVTPATEGPFVCNTLQYFAFLFDIVSGSNEASIYFIFRPVIPWGPKLNIKKIERFSSSCCAAREQSNLHVIRHNWK